MSDYQLPAGYKQTEVGVIPEDWEVYELGEVITLQRGFDLPSRLRKPGNIPIVSSSGVIDKHNQASVLKPGVVTGRYGTIGEVFFINEDFWALNTTLFVSNFKGNDPLFIYFFLKTVDYKSYSGKSGVPGVNRNDLHEIFVKLPPLPEQRSLAQALSDVDALISAIDKLIAKKRDLKTATMQQLLTGKKRLPGFGEEWQTIKVGDLFEITAGGDLVKSKYSKLHDDVHPYPIYANSVFDGGIYGYSKFKNYECGCITVTARGTLGVAYYRATPFVAIGRLIVLKPKGELDSFFLSELINHRIEFANESTSVPQLTAPQISKCELSIPVVEEQRAIATVLSDMDNAIAALESRLAKTQAIKQGMMQELLTGKTRLL